MPYKKLVTTLKRTLVISCIGTALLASCAQVQIKDAEVCGDEGIDGATCFHTQTTQTRDIDPVQWNEERFGQLCLKSDAFAEFKKELEEACSLNKCTYDQTQALNEFFARVKSFTEKTSLGRQRE